MPKQTYNFTKVGEGVESSLLHIRLTNPTTKQSKYFVALLDTGADECLFPQVCANDTGHNLKGEGVESSVNQGVGESKVPVWKHTFIIEILSADLKTTMWKSKPQLISCVDHDNIHPLLGWKGCMENLNIRFNYPTKKIVIEFP